MRVNTATFLRCRKGTGICRVACFHGYRFHACVHLFVCFVVCLRARESQEPHVPTSPNFTCACRVDRTVYSRLSILRRRCNTLCISGFVDDVAFSYSGSHGEYSCRVGNSSMLYYCLRTPVGAGILASVLQLYEQIN